MLSVKLCVHFHHRLQDGSIWSWLLTLVNLHKYCSNCSISIFCFFASVHKPWFRGPMWSCTPSNHVTRRCFHYLYLYIYIYINMISFGEAPPCSSEWLAFSNWCFQKFLISSPKILTGFPIWFPLKIRYPLEIHRWMMILPDRNGMGEIGIQLVPLQVIAGKLEDEMIPCLELCKDQSFSAKSSIFLRPLILSNHTSLCWTTWIYIYIYMLYI